MNICNIKKMVPILSNISLACFLIIPSILGLSDFETVLFGIMLLSAYAFFRFLQEKALIDNKIWACYVIGYLYGFIALYSMIIVINVCLQYSFWVRCVCMIGLGSFLLSVMFINRYREILESNK